MLSLHGILGRNDSMEKLKTAKGFNNSKNSGCNTLCGYKVLNFKVLFFSKMFFVLFDVLKTA